MMKKTNNTLNGVMFLTTAVFLLASATANSQVNIAEEDETTVREQVKDHLEEVKERVQEKVSQIKDKAKRAAAEKITVKFEHINEVWTNHFDNVLDKLEDALEKIKSRRDKALVNGEDVALVDAAIEEAEDSIDEARLAVNAQSQKTYVVDVLAVDDATATESSQQNLIKELKEQFTLLRNQLFSDLMGLRDGPMKNAKAKVHDALQALSQIPHVDEEP